VARSGALLLSGTLLANVAAYAFFVILSRRLPEDALGAVGAMVNLTTIAAVPALGLQLVAAREVAVARRRDREPDTTTLDGQIVRLGLELGVLAALAVVVLSPFLAHLLHVDVSMLVVLAASMVPLGVTFAVQGVLQGEERFGALAAVLGASGLGKLGAALVAVWLGGGALLVVGALTAFWLLTAFLALALLPRHRRRPARGHRSTLRRMVAAAAVPTSGLLVLSSLDVLLARHHLSPADSGAYTVGALFEKAALWGMAFLATLFYPGMARATERRRATTRALAVTAGVGALGVLVTAAAARPLVALAGGATYADLAPVLWRFTLLGVLLALVQVLVYAALAVARPRAGIAVWIGALASVLAAQAAHRRVEDIVTVMLLSTGALVIALLVSSMRRGALPERRRWTQRQ
jgi:O-antigen/teichoic acid export membrane protein